MPKYLASLAVASIGHGSHAVAVSETRIGLFARQATASIEFLWSPGLLVLHFAQLYCICNLCCLICDVTQSCSFGVSWFVGFYCPGYRPQDLRFRAFTKQSQPRASACGSLGRIQVLTHWGHGFQTPNAEPPQHTGIDIEMPGGGCIKPKGFPSTARSRVYGWILSMGS